MTVNWKEVDVCDQIRLMNAAPKLFDALEAMLPLAEKEYLQLDMLCKIGCGDAEAREQAQRWLEATLLAACALKEAMPPPQLKPADRARLKVLEMRRSL